MFFKAASTLQSVTPSNYPKHTVDLSLPSDCWHIRFTHSQLKSSYALLYKQLNMLFLLETSRHYWKIASHVGGHLLALQCCTGRASSLVRHPCPLRRSIKSWPKWGRSTRETSTTSCSATAIISQRISPSGCAKENRPTGYSLLPKTCRPLLGLYSLCSLDTVSVLGGCLSGNHSC